MQYMDSTSRHVPSRPVRSPPLSAVNRKAVTTCTNIERGGMFQERAFSKSAFGSLWLYGRRRQDGTANRKCFFLFLMFSEIFGELLESRESITSFQNGFRTFLIIYLYYINRIKIWERHVCSREKFFAPLFCFVFYYLFPRALLKHVSIWV